ncbi:MAG: hypothetical protein AAGH79_11415, partial [Bacteroidota bacterium]
AKKGYKNPYEAEGREPLKSDDRLYRLQVLDTLYYGGRPVPPMVLSVMGVKGALRPLRILGGLCVQKRATKVPQKRKEENH